MTLRRRAAGVRNRLLGSVAPVPPPGSTPPAPPSASVRDIDAATPAADDAVDVVDLLNTYTVEQLSEAADEYYRTNLAGDGRDYYFAKPATGVDEASEILICFAQVLAGVRPIRGMRVLDFGAGTGWTSRFLTQLGCEVVVCDVSATALDVARELFARQPVAGDQPEPTYLRFDGHHLDLPDESIDRIFCIDAFHHVPNPAAVLHELGRVLRPGGVAGFQEPGPNHSKDPQSQFEMKNFTVIENDVRMRDIAKWADAAGFTGLELAIFTWHPFHTSIEGYEDYLAHGATADLHYEHHRQFVANRRIFFLSKGEPLVADSRDPRGLRAEIQATPDQLTATPGGIARVQLTLRNTGTGLWLPSDGPAIGRVLVGAHLYDGHRRMLERDHLRAPLPAPTPSGVAPGEQVTLSIEVPVPDAPGNYTVALDLVAEGVCWFENIDTAPAIIQIAVG